MFAEQPEWRLGLLGIAGLAAAVVVGMLVQKGDPLWLMGMLAGVIGTALGAFGVSVVYLFPGFSYGEALLLVAWITFVSRKGEAFRSNYELPTLLSFTLAMLCPVIGLIKLRASFTRQKLKNLAPQAHTPREERRTVTALRRAFRRSKVCLLAPLLVPWLSAESSPC